MSLATVVKKSGLFTAAAALTAAGLLTIPAPAQSAPCSQWGFNGPFTFTQGNGWTVTFDTRRLDEGGYSTDPNANAYGKHTGGKSMQGNVSTQANIDGSSISFEITWRNGSVGSYSGLVDNNGFAHGHNNELTQPHGTDYWDSTVALVCAPRPTKPANNNPPAQPDTCIQGYVSREARDGDTVCVTLDVRVRIAQENANPSLNREPGADTCKQGFVWREAFDGDTICVTPDIRTQTWADNAAAASRRAN